MVRLTVQVPSPAMAKVALHTVSEGSIRQGPLGFPVCRPDPLASAPWLVLWWAKVAVEPGHRPLPDRAQQPVADGEVRPLVVRRVDESDRVLGEVGAVGVQEGDPVGRRGPNARVECRTVSPRRHVDDLRPLMKGDVDGIVGGAVVGDEDPPREAGIGGNGRAGLAEHGYLLEFDEYPTGPGRIAAPRPHAPGALVPGCAMASLATLDLDRVAPLAIAPPVRRDGPGYDGQRACTVRGPTGELIEFIEERPA